MLKPVYRVVFYYKYTLYPLYVRNKRGLPRNFRNLQKARQETKKWANECCKAKIIKV